MIEKLHDAGLRSQHAYMAGFASIGLSFAAWATSLKAEKAGTDRADRWAIFVGHWAPHLLRPRQRPAQLREVTAAHGRLLRVHEGRGFRRAAIRLPQRYRKPSALLHRHDQRRTRRPGRGSRPAPGSAS